MSNPSTLEQLEAAVDARLAEYLEKCKCPKLGELYEVFVELARSQGQFVRDPSRDDHFMQIAEHLENQPEMPVEVRMLITAHKHRLAPVDEAFAEFHKGGKVRLRAAIHRVVTAELVLKALEEEITPDTGTHPQARAAIMQARTELVQAEAALRSRIPGPSGLTPEVAAILEAIYGFVGPFLDMFGGVEGIKAILEKKMAESSVGSRFKRAMPSGLGVGPTPEDAADATEDDADDDEAEGESTFLFEAMDATGAEISDEITAPSEELAIATMKQMGYFVTKITRKKKKATATA